MLEFRFNKHVSLYKSIIDKKRNVSSHFDEASFPENHIINENQFQSQNPLKNVFRFILLRRSEIFVRMYKNYHKKVFRYKMYWDNT